MASTRNGMASTKRKFGMVSTKKEWFPLEGMASTKWNGFH